MMEITINVYKKENEELKNKIAEFIHNEGDY